MWERNYMISSICIDIAFLACALLQTNGGAWLLYSWKCAIKVVVLISSILIWSSRSQVWVPLTALVALSFFPPYICIVVADRRWRASDLEFVAIVTNRILETPVLSLFCRADAVRTVGRIRVVSRAKVVPHPHSDTDSFVARICTWVELNLADDDENVPAICSICLDRIELNEVVKQLVCKHVFHVQCASRWMRRCSRLGQEESICPMRCALKKMLDHTQVD
eukprot:TRINITY_DN25337_c0_g1_i1.p1 TRINITY_DN25337_c0_g1~~TRINITY_DN25337_c0_g1_i1.p1  ORF type:complete len:222 (+),score=14.35 TRINITY_DN25337_c0_g1_i1:40-705(+)